MKKLAVAIGLILASQAVDAAEVYNKDGNKLDFYGSARARHYFGYDTSVDGDQSYVRFGFKGQTQITKQLTGYGQWEYNVQANHTEAANDSTVGTKTRLGFAGLKFDKYGSLDYGRNWGVGYDVSVITDTPPIFDDETMSYVDNYMTGRANGLLTYRNNGFFGLVDGLNIGLQYQGKNANDSNNGTSARPTKTANGDGFGLSSGYTFGKSGITLLGVYTNSDRTIEQEATAQKGKGSKAEMWATGIKYDANNLYLATMYGENHNMTSLPAGSPLGNGAINKTQNFEVVAQYLFDFGLKPQIGYFQSKAKDVEGLGTNGGMGSADLHKYISVGATYFFNKNMNVYTDYKINLLEPTTVTSSAHTNELGANTDNKFGVGLTYQF